MVERPLRIQSLGIERQSLREVRGSIPWFSRTFCWFVPFYQRVLCLVTLDSPYNWPTRRQCEFQHE